MEENNILYSLSMAQGPNYKTIKTLTKEEYDKYIGYIHKLLSYAADHQLFRVVDLNYCDLKDKIKYYEDTWEIKRKTLGQKGETREYLLNLYFDLNRLLLNLLSSIKTFLDHTETRFNREYGEESPEFKYFKSETSTVFDNNFAYKFLYALRNYSQHCGIPIGSCGIGSSNDGNGGMVHSAVILFERDVLLSKYSKWKHAEQELKAQKEKFEVIPLIENFFELIKILNQKFKDKELSRFTLECNELLELINATKGEKGVPCLYAKYDENSGQVYGFPYYMISKLTGFKIDSDFANSGGNEWLIDGLNPIV